MAENSTLLPAYLINGEDELKRETVLKRLRSRVAELGDIDFNCDTFDGETALGADIVSACNTMPFASEVRLVVVHSAELLKKQDSEAVVDYLKASSPTTVLCLVAQKLAKNTRLYKAVAAIGKKAVIDCAPMKKYELPKTVRSMAVSHGITMNEAAAERLVDLVGENTVRLDAELKKLAVSHAANGQPVGVSEVEAMVSQTAEVKPWFFVDAFAARDIAQCMELLGKMESVSPHALIVMCENRLRELTVAHALARRGQSGAKALASYLKVPDWRVKNHMGWARKWSREELTRSFSSMRDCERAMKSGADPEAAFVDWMISVLAGR